MATSSLSTNAIMISMLIDGFPAAIVESFGESPIQWTDREIAERFATPDNVPKNVIKNASYICTLSLTADSILGKLMNRVCGDEVGRSGLTFKDAPSIQMTITNLSSGVVEVYTQGIITSLPAGTSYDNTKAGDYNFVIAFHERKV